MRYERHEEGAFKRTLYEKVERWVVLLALIVLACDLLVWRP